MSREDDAGTVGLRCIIVDDNAAFLRASCALLEGQGIRVIATASTGDDALRLAGESAADVILLDIDLGGESGFDVARLLATAGNGVAATVILISTYPEDDFADLIAASPTAGFIAKSDLSAQSIAAVLARSGGG
jgi:DNA-binding NarL/FixJ family response regulator